MKNSLHFNFSKRNKKVSFHFQFWLSLFISVNFLSVWNMAFFKVMDFFLSCLFSDKSLCYCVPVSRSTKKTFLAFLSQNPKKTLFCSFRDLLYFISSDFYFYWRVSLMTAILTQKKTFKRISFCEKKLRNFEERLRVFPKGSKNIFLCCPSFLSKPAE